MQVAPPSPEEISSLSIILSNKVIGSYADMIFSEALQQPLPEGVDLLLPKNFTQRRGSL